MPAGAGSAPGAAASPVTQTTWAGGVPGSVVWFGVVSYSVYLWHEPLVMFLGRHGLMASGVAGVVLNIALVLALTSALSALTYRFVEAPAMRRKSRLATPVQERV